MKIYVSGDSFTYGDELKDRTVSSWPNLLAKKLNAEMVDTSMSGSSNERILFHTTRHFAEDFIFILYPGANLIDIHLFVQTSLKKK